MGLTARSATFSYLLDGGPKAVAAVTQQLPTPNWRWTDYAALKTVRSNDNFGLRVIRFFSPSCLLSLSLYPLTRPFSINWLSSSFPFPSPPSCSATAYWKCTKRTTRTTITIMPPSPPQLLHRPSSHIMRQEPNQCPETSPEFHFSFSFSPRSIQ